MTPPSNAKSIAEALACGRPGCGCQQTARTGKGNTHCPTHADQHPSLSVSEKQGKVLVHCQAGCSQEAVIKALQERGLWPKESTPSRQRSKGETPEANYDYRDESGALLYQVLRHPGKTFKQRRPDGKGGWAWNLDGVRRVPYRLPELLGAPKDAWVFIAEGEKDADRLASLGLVATTNSGGAGKWDEPLSPFFKGRPEAILPDNDAPGQAHARDVARKLAPYAAVVKVIELPGLSSGGDVSDWLTQGHSAAELLALVEEAPAWVPPPMVDLAGLLDDVGAFLRRFVVLREAEKEALALWVAHTWALEAAESTPYLSIQSAEKRSGKTRLLETLALLVARPWLTGRVTAAVLVRKVDRESPTLLLDEGDAAFKGEKEYAEALRALLNAGHRRGGVASLCVRAGSDFELRDFSTFGPKAIAGIAKLPDTVADRSIKIELRRRAPNEPMARFRQREVKAQADPIREALGGWATTAISALTEARPSIPEALDDRAADGWEPLLAIADMAGGEWPRRAREAAKSLSVGDDREDDSLGVRLLADIRRVFGDCGSERLPSADLVAALVGIEEAPWGDLRGKPLDARTLARMLKPYGVRPHQIRFGERTVKGYESADFADAWSRYTPQLTETRETSETNDPSVANCLATDGLNVSDVSDVSLISGMREQDDGDAKILTFPSPQEFCFCGAGVYVFTPEGKAFCREHAPELAEVAESW